MELTQRLFTEEYQRLLERLKGDSVEGHTLAIPGPPKKVYIKSDCFKDFIGAVFIKED